MNDTAPPAAALSGREQLEVMMRAGMVVPIGSTLGFALVEVGDGLATFEATPGEHVYNPLGTVHGGFAAALLDPARPVPDGIAEGRGITPDERFAIYRNNVVEGLM